MYAQLQGGEEFAGGKKLEMTPGSEWYEKVKAAGLLALGGIFAVRT